MNTVAITLDDMLRARDERAAAQTRLLREYGCPLISFTMNMAGPVKRTPLSELAFDRGLRELYDTLGAPLAQEIVRADTGCEARLAYNCPAQALKDVCLRLETQAQVGRLYDLDVLDVTGEKLSRPTPRACIVCGNMVTVCSRSRAHGLDAVVCAINSILVDFAADELSALAECALLQEAELTPKPGLVDGRNSGAHTDMDLPLFRRSAKSLTVYFRRMVNRGLENAPAAALQALGVEAEGAMFAATGGVNTHKGALYSLSLLLAACGRCLASGGDAAQTAAALARELTPPQRTHGAAVARRYGVGGVRAEAMAGFPTVRRAAALLTGSDALTVLLWLMANTEDSNVYHRGGAEGAAYVQRSAREILSAPKENRAALLEALDERFIARRLSPGGCADLLALALFWQSLPSFLTENGGQPGGKGGILPVRK